MKLRIKQFNILSLTTLFAFCITFSKAKVKENLIYQEAAKQLSALKTTSYTIDTTVSWSKGEFDYTCSGFLSYTIEQISQKALNVVPVPADGATFPDSYTFTDYFASLNTTTSPYYKLLTNISELLPGDMITWKDPINDPDNGTGHSVIVWDIPYHMAKDDDDKYSGCDFESDGHWVVPVIDSTQYPHGANDTRSQACKDGSDLCTIGTYVNDEGLGLGNIGLVAQPPNQPGDKRYGVGYPIQYLWDGQSTGHNGMCNTTEITMVRYIGAKHYLPWWAIFLIVLACVGCCGGIWCFGFRELKQLFIDEEKKRMDSEKEGDQGYIQFKDSPDQDSSRIMAVRGDFTTAA